MADARRFGQGRVHDMALSADGTRLLIASDSGLWMRRAPDFVAETWLEEQTLDTALSPDGRWAAVCGSGGSVQIWDADAGRFASSMERPDGSSVKAAAFSPDGLWLAGAVFGGGNSLDGVAVWRAGYGAERGKIYRHFESPDVWQYGSRLPIVFSPDGRYLALPTQGAGEPISVWDIETGRRAAVLQTDGDIYNLAFSPRGDALAAGCYPTQTRSGTRQKGHALVWDVNGWKRRETYADFGGCAVSASYAPDGTLRAAAVDIHDGAVSVWDVEKGTVLYSDRTAQAFHHPCRFVNGSHFAYFLSGVQLRVWTYGCSEPIKVPHSHGNCPLSLLFCGDRLASVGGHIGIVLWSVKERRALSEFRPLGAGDSYSAALPPNGNLAAASADENAVKIWDLETETQTKALALPKSAGEIHATALSASGGVAAAGDENGTIHVWDIQSGKMRFAVEGGDGAVVALAFSPDGRFLTDGGNLWDAADGTAVSEFEDERLQAAAFSPCGRFAAAYSGRRNEIAVWDINRRETRLRIPDEMNAAYSCFAFSPDGKRLAGGTAANNRSEKTEVQIWSMKNGRRMRSVLSKEILSLAFSPDGKTLAAGLLDETILLLDAG